MCLCVYGRDKSTDRSFNKSINQEKSVKRHTVQIPFLRGAANAFVVFAGGGGGGGGGVSVFPYFFLYLTKIKLYICLI